MDFQRCWPVVESAKARLTGDIARPQARRKGSIEDLKDAVSVADIHATILKSLGIDHQLELDTPVGHR